MARNNGKYGEEPPDPMDIGRFLGGYTAKAIDTFRKGTDKKEMEDKTTVRVSNGEAKKIRKTDRTEYPSGGQSYKVRKVR